MADILLIHGAGHGAWCWRHVVPTLRAMGHTVRAIDLPSHGNDPTPVQGVTLDDYVTAVLHEMAPRTILTGHSLGGLSITAAAVGAPENIAALVYLCAWVPIPGIPLTVYREKGATAALRDSSTLDTVRDVAIFDRKASADLFYHDCAPADRNFALDRLRPQPMAPHRTPIAAPDPAVPRYYVRCLRDRAIDPAYQTCVSRDWPTDRVFDMDTGHSPFFAAPDRLAQILDTIAKAAT